MSLELSSGRLFIPTGDRIVGLLRRLGLLVVVVLLAPLLGRRNLTRRNIGRILFFRLARLIAFGTRMDSWEEYSVDKMPLPLKKVHYDRKECKRVDRLRWDGCGLYLRDYGGSVRSLLEEMRNAWQ